MAETYADFANRLDQALATRRDATYISRIERLAKEHTWDNRAETISHALENGLPALTSAVKG